MSHIAIIPARYGSTRFPGKALADILGKPLIQRVYEQARLVHGLKGIYVATDDARIQECVAGFGGQALMTRSDHLSGTDRLAEAAEILGLDKNDVVINIQGDQPVFPAALGGPSGPGGGAGLLCGHGHPGPAPLIWTRPAIPMWSRWS
jgi:3-deoxy-manno-octulosonate cytidylyltransferase (CMP-KDO synthetase)